MTSARTIFLSFASGSFLKARDELCQSALKVGFDEVRARGFEDLDASFMQKNAAILSNTRGAGYWLWKPQIILQELETLNEDDVLVYSDAGRSAYYQFKVFPKKLITQTKEKKFLLGPTIGQHGPMSKWTKRDAFILMNMDRPEVYELPPIQATWSFWTNSKESIDFLKKWLSYCSDPRILTDMENTQGFNNLTGFVDHRHDQSILTLLAHKEKVPYLNYRNSLIEKILLLRPQSKVAHYYLKRINDAETSFDSSYIVQLFSLIKAWYSCR